MASEQQSEDKTYNTFSHELIHKLVEQSFVEIQENFKEFYECLSKIISQAEIADNLLQTNIAKETIRLEKLQTLQNAINGTLKHFYDLTKSNISI